MTPIEYTELYDFEKIANSSSMPELANIAISILEKLSFFGEVHQLCGPMSTGGFNQRETNIKLFTFAIEVAREKGLLIFNQIPFQKAMVRLSSLASQGQYKQDILDFFYLPVFQSGFVKKILFLPLWETSLGAVWERNVLKTMNNASIDEYPLAWYEEALKKAGLSHPLSTERF